MLANVKRRGFSYRLPRCRLLCAWGLASMLTGLMLCVLPPAWAGPPYSVDDAGTLDYRCLFLYVAEIGSLSQGGYTHPSPNLVLGYGIKLNLEASFGMSGYTSNTPSIALDITNSYNNPALALKWRFREEGRHTPAFAYQATLDRQTQD